MIKQVNSEFPQEELSKLQQEAVKRVKEMQYKVKTTFENSQKNINKNQSGNEKYENFQKEIGIFSQENTKKQNENINHEITPKVNKIQHYQKNLFDMIFKNEEQILILTLIIILMGEEENLAILLTLIYILM
ncbi:hypothetical protein FACS189465_2610 [Clostridia bacterium]|nr:hypothetical protein FACS189465_2610 [Clostridia bacterium]